MTWIMRTVKIRGKKVKMNEYIRDIDKCRWVKMVFDVAICRLNCAPCFHVDPKNCESIREVNGGINDKEKDK